MATMARQLALLLASVESYSNVRCTGPVLASVEVADSEECSVLCDNELHCNTWTYYNNHSCVLQKYCQNFIPTVHTVVTDNVPALPRQLHCSVPERGVLCKSHSIAVHRGATSDECCDLCAATTGCLLYTVANDTCHLKSACPEKSYTQGNFSTGYMQRPSSTTHKSYHRVGRGVFHVSGYICGNGEKTTLIFYPKGPGPYGVVIHRAGFDGGIDRMDDWLETIASLGMIVLAPFTAAGGCSNVDSGAHAWMDTLTLVKAAMVRTLHPALAKADWTRLALMGHSMGAQAAIEAAVHLRNLELFPYDNITVLAVLASHDAVGSVAQIHRDVALMITTGSLDTAFPPSDAEGFFNQSRSKHRVFASMYRAHHMEPHADIHFEERGWEGGGARENWWTSQFLSCHITGHWQHCEAVYGHRNQSLRNVHHWSRLRIHNHSAESNSTALPPKLAAIV